MNETVKQGDGAMIKLPLIPLARWKEMTGIYLIFRSLFFCDCRWYIDEWDKLLVEDNIENKNEKPT